MKVDIKEIDHCKRQLNIEVSNEILNRETDLAYESLRKKTSMRGFRKGKVPRPILEKYYSKNVQQEVLKKIIPETCRKVIEENNIKAVGRPLVDDIKIDEENPLFFTATVDVIPDIKLMPYANLKFSKRIKRVTDSDIERELKLFQERFAEFESVEDKPVEVSDYVVIDIESPEHDINGQERIIKNHPVVIGSNPIIKDIEDELINMKKDEEKTIKANFPKDYPDDNLAGNEVTLKIKVNEIKKKILREIDDTFAKEFGECETVDDLRKRIKQKLESIEKNNSEANLKMDIMKKLIEDNKFDLPPILVDAQVNAMIEDVKRKSIPAGKEIDSQKYQHDENLRQIASNIIKEDILQDLIAEAEDITVTEEELDEEIKKLASLSNSNPHTVKRDMQKKGSIDSLMSRIKRDKVMKFLIEEKLDIKEIFVES